VLKSGQKLGYYITFSLGLEFSFKKLMKVGGTASITAITQIITMVLMVLTNGMLETNGQHLLGVILSDFLPRHEKRNKRHRQAFLSR
jgi:Kef-type K+ transport system membrane component KefB